MKTTVYCVEYFVKTSLNEIKDDKTRNKLRLQYLLYLKYKKRNNKKLCNSFK